MSVVSESEVTHDGSQDSEPGGLSLQFQTPETTPGIGRVVSESIDRLLIPKLKDTPDTNIGTRLSDRLQMRRRQFEQVDRSFSLYADMVDTTMALYHLDPDEQVQPLMLGAAVPPKSSDCTLPTLKSSLLDAPSTARPSSGPTMHPRASLEIDYDTRIPKSHHLVHQQDSEEQPISAVVGSGRELATETVFDARKPEKGTGKKLRRVINYIYSTTLLVFSLWLVIGVILTEKARLAKDPHPFATFVVSWFLLVWLATMEGGQGCLIGLQRVEKKNYAFTHPIALKCTTLAHKGDNMERFIVGRQFLVFVVVFLTNMFKVMNAPDSIVEHFFLSTGQFWSGAAIILTTITLGQLTAQVNAANCMLDFINHRIMLFTTYVSLFIENTGILHSAYLVQIVFPKIAGIPIGTKEKRAASQKTFFWGRVLMSLGLLGYAFAVTLSAVLQGKTTMWASVPGAVAATLFFALMLFVGMFEALQIALFEVIHMPEEYFANHKVAKANCDLAFRGKNLQAILIGRQICVTTGVFMIARITTPDFRDGETIFGVSQGMQRFFNTGLLGAFITTIVASLAWRIVAASFPLEFLSNPLVHHTIRLCLLLENSGICSASWVFALYHKTISGLRVDEVYLGKNDEPNKADAEEGPHPLQNVV